MATINNQHVVGVFHRWEDAQAAIEHLRNVNVDSGEISSYDKAGDSAGLASRGLPEYEIKYYQSAIAKKHVVVLVDSATRQQELADILNQHGAENIEPGPGVDPAAAAVPHFDGMFDHRDDSGSATTGFSAMGAIKDALKHTPFHIPSTGQADDTIPPLNFEDPDQK